MLVVNPDDALFARSGGIDLLGLQRAEDQARNRAAPCCGWNDTAACPVEACKGTGA